MTEVTQILMKIEAGDLSASARLLPLVYDELRRLAAVKLSQEKAGHSLQATALVHEAYLRLVGEPHASPTSWDHRGHFVAAAAEAMRRILVEHARQKKRLKHGGGLFRLEFVESDIVATETSEDLLALDEALEKLAAIDERGAELVKLRYFVGLTVGEVAKAMQISTRTAERVWTYSRAWLHREMAAPRS